MKLLHIDSGLQGDRSVTRQLSATILARLTAENPSIEVVTRDLVADPIPHLTPGDLDAEAPLTAEALAQFLGSDIVVIGAPMYNFAIPSQLKAWIDRILIAGKTFRYTANGPEPLAGGRRVIVAVSRGGLYGEGSQMRDFEHVETYLGHVFGFIGITPEFIVAEGINLGDEARDTAIGAAKDRIGSLPA